MSTLTPSTLMNRTPKTPQEFKGEALAHAEAWQENLDTCRAQLANVRQWMDVATAIYPDLRTMVPAVIFAVVNEGRLHVKCIEDADEETDRAGS